MEISVNTPPSSTCSDSACSAVTSVTWRSSLTSGGETGVATASAGAAVEGGGCSSNKLCKLEGARSSLAAKQKTAEAATSMCWYLRS
eukprot:SAG11_NODE_114_length_16040_cov_10.050875_7_plen_87_part_00